MNKERLKMMKTETASFKVSKVDRRYIDQIVDRAMLLVKKHGGDYDRVDCMMDITATHANGCRLDLAKLLNADDFNFSHDVFGIYRHINRETGRLERFFIPRFASRDSSSGNKDE